MYLIFKRYEPIFVRQHAVLLLAPPLVLAHAVLSAHYAYPRAVLAALALHLTTVAGATLLYRASPWHPLARYPGPFTHRLSKLVLAWTTRHGKQWLHVKALHDRYGDIVRIGACDGRVMRVKRVLRCS